MTADVFIFWFLALVTIASGLGVLMMTNPVYSALSLVMAMVGVAGLFVTLDAHFLAGVQLIVYAGAVMVLFVMVLMLFDLKQETKAFSRGKFTGAVKIAAVGLITGLVAGGIYMSADSIPPAGEDVSMAGVAGTKTMGSLLFNEYILGFEVLGILLLVVAIGTVALARSKGGTHAKH